jgi:N-acetylglutamate synthase
MRYRYEVRIGPDDVGRRVVIRWRRPTGAGGDEVADVLGQLEQADEQAFTVRDRHGGLVVVPRARALAAKVVPSRP